MRLCAPLETEDYVVQSMPDASPTKWHLAHTAWFFEEFILSQYQPRYQRLHERYGLLFNSYYMGVGSAFTRAERGLLSRPTVAEVLRYRVHVDAAMDDLLARGDSSAEVLRLVELGCHHEQQHQELLLTDLQHALSLNPLQPAYRPAQVIRATSTVSALRYLTFDGGIKSIGHARDGFAFDNETPRHDVLLRPFRLADRLITNSEYREFVESGGYRDPAHWLSDGWATVASEGWARPLYWSDDNLSEFTLTGVQDIDPAAPVSHLSFYEADAYARAVGARLPTEHEWETAAADQPVEGNLLECDNLQPVPVRASRQGMAQLFGDVWEWTQSPYSPYPGFKPWNGRIAEYNGKFMANQFVLRGGSCVTSTSHVRATYRNFFPPTARWQFAGVRLAKDC